jgi:fructosamine-3-kinase
MSEPHSALGVALQRALGVAVRSLTPVPGGDINDAWRAVLADGRSLFVKTRPGADAAEYEAEAAGLRWLAEARALPVPAVLACAQPGGEDPPFLALEWIERGALAPAGRDALGRGLAALHAAGAPSFGFVPGGGDQTRIGPVLLPNRRREEWPAFYAESRLLPLLRMARDRGALSERGARAVESVCGRIGELAGPAEPPARLHGDLWSGNVLADADGRPWLIDPAAYGGHREIDLAMLRLFGDPGSAFFAAYAELRPLAEGHEERAALWQLLPLLVHAVLFGGGYGASAERAARRYVD